jgi:ADP-ribose pyrophosphatase YjhB (NUDIX family)
MEGKTSTEPTESADRKKALASPEPMKSNGHDQTVEEMTKTLREDLATLKCEGRVFAPQVPSKEELEAGANANGKILSMGTLVLQRASFNALWIRIGCLRQKVPSVALLNAVVKTAVEVQEALEPRKAAVYIGISESCLSGAAIDFDFLHSQGFFFHHYRPSADKAAEPLGELVYVVDLDDVVPVYATSIEGATGIILSPEADKVLAVWERGGWSTPGGAVNQGEMEIDALHREIREEVGLEVDAEVQPIYLGGYQQSNARDGRINDNFSAFLVQTTTEAQPMVDNKEIHNAMWLPWECLVSEWKEKGRSIKDKNVALESSVLPEDKRTVSRNLLCFLERYQDAKGIPCKVTPGKECKIGLGI